MDDCAAWANARADEHVRHEQYRQIDQDSEKVDSEMSHCHAEGVAIQVCDFEESTAVQVVSVRCEVRDEAVQHARDEPS